MKKLLLMTVLAGFFAVEGGDVLEPGVINPERYVIRNMYGDSKGFVEKDVIVTNRWNVRSRTMDRKGHLEPGTLTPESWRLRKW